ncbi:MAG: hypothetical protein IJA97_06395 [Clostridia bacterium]|nr:hypothetical protein [Clostridia bacterium]
MYQSIYNILQTAIYESAVLTGWQELFLTIVSSACVLFAIAVPFMVVWKVIQLICGR